MDEPVEHGVREVLGGPLERTSHDALHPLSHLLSNQLLKSGTHRYIYV